MGEPMSSLDHWGKKAAEEQDAILDRLDRLPAIRQRLFASAHTPRASRKSSRTWVVGGALALAASVILMIALPKSHPLTFVVGLEDARGALGAWIAAPEGGDYRCGFPMARCSCSISGIAGARHVDRHVGG